jgi:transcriptional regulator with XRE-family HTH domain
MGFKENLKSQLAYSGMLVKELAVRSGIKKKTIDSYLQSNSYTPSVEAAVSIAKALGVTVENLVTGKDPVKGIPISTLPVDVQEIIHALKDLNTRDRNIVLNLARLLKNR